jgi:hypothetical protein
MYQIKNQDPAPDPYQIEKLDPDRCQNGLDPQHWFHPEPGKIT